MKIKAVLFFLLLFLNIISVNAQENVTTYRKMKIGVNLYANTLIRAHPTTSSRIMGKIEKFKFVKVLGRTKTKTKIGRWNDYWYHVRRKRGKNGWIYGKLLFVYGESLSMAECVNLNKRNIGIILKFEDNKKSHLYAKPNENSRVIMTLQPKDLINIIKKVNVDYQYKYFSSKWFLVKTIGGKTGYIPGAFFFTFDFLFSQTLTEAVYAQTGGFQLKFYRNALFESTYSTFARFNLNKLPIPVKISRYIPQKYRNTNDDYVVYVRFKGKFYVKATVVFFVRKYCYYSVVKPEVKPKKWQKIFIKPSFNYMLISLGGGPPGGMYVLLNTPYGCYINL